MSLKVATHLFANKLVQNLKSLYLQRKMVTHSSATVGTPAVGLYQLSTQVPAWLDGLGCREEHACGLPWSKGAVTSVLTQESGSMGCYAKGKLQKGTKEIQELSYILVIKRKRKRTS